jgi:dihydrofolate synthase/folylpolyglutamate synthase
LTHTTLQGALEALYGLERRRDKLGLDGTRALLAALGDPHRRFRAVHVAGTNGKGTTCAYVERALREAGHRTGLFTSPHLVDFRERIRVDGRWADEGWLFRTLRRIGESPAGSDRTFFEVATALGFAWFAEQGVEWAVVEVGLGGRLDTTNVLEPAVCAITSIGLDHTEILGGTLEAVAYEKAGILKPGVPAAIGPALPAAARVAIERVAEARGVPLVAAAGGGPFRDDDRAVARSVLEVLAGRGVRLPAEAVARGLAAARWPGRLEPSAREPRLWWDGAHNGEAAGALAAAWRAAGHPAPRALVLATSRDKDLDAILAPLATLAPGAHLVAARSRSERAQEPGRIAERARHHRFEAHLAHEVAPACRQALALAGPGGWVLLTGSLFAVGEAMEHFGGAPGEQL